MRICPWRRSSLSLRTKAVQLRAKLKSHRLSRRTGQVATAMIGTFPNSDAHAYDALAVSSELHWSRRLSWMEGQIQGALESVHEWDIRVDKQFCLATKQRICTEKQIPSYPMGPLSSLYRFSIFHSTQLAMNSTKASSREQRSATVLML